jgi:hypothetical protein
MDKPLASSTRSDLLAEIEQEWTSIERLCASLSQADMVRSGVEGEWSVKDILCHISAWEKYLLDRLGMVMTGQAPRYPVMSSWDDVHQFNAQVYEENKEHSLNSAILEFRNLFRGVMTILEALRDDQLNQPYSYDFPDDQLTLLRLIRANTCDHLREHRLAIEKERNI